MRKKVLFIACLIFISSFNLSIISCSSNTNNEDSTNKDDDSTNNDEDNNNNNEDTSPKEETILAEFNKDTCPNLVNSPKTTDGIYLINDDVTDIINDITLKYSKNYKGTLLTILIINLIVSGIGFVTPILSAKYISYLTNGLFNNLLYIIIVQTITYIVSIFLRLISSKMNRYYDFKIKRKLQLELTRATLTIDQNILNKENSGTFIEELMVLLIYLPD